METNNELTPQRSLELINDAIEHNRRTILRQSAGPLITWGTLLFAFSLAIALLWGKTGKPIWNMLWFAMPLVGFPLSAFLNRRVKDVPCNTVSRMLTATWLAFCVFSVCTSLAGVFVAPINFTVAISLLFGFALTLSGILLKNWPVIIGGFFIGLGGAIVGGLLSAYSYQLLVFTVGGLVLALTGVAVMIQNK